MDCLPSSLDHFGPEGVEKDFDSFCYTKIALGAFY